MSDISQAPPPAPPAAPPQPSFDFIKPFTFAFQDPKWVPKILIGGLFYIAAFLIVGLFFLLGYCAKLARNVVEGQENPLPEWDDLGEYFIDGLRMFGVGFVYVLPFVLLALVVIVPVAILGESGSETLENVAGGIATCVWCLLFPLGLALGFWLPGAMMMVAMERSFGAGFEFGRIWRFISGNIGNYLLAYVVHLVAQFAAQFGIILFCIGVVFTAFWSFLVTTYAFAQAYRLSPAK